MANEIKIIVGGDVAGLVRASQQSASALDSMGSAAETAAKDFAQLGPSTQKATAAIERFKNGLRDPAGQNLTDNLAQGFQSILRPIDELEAELTQLQQVIRRTTFILPICVFRRSAASPNLFNSFGICINRCNI